MNWEDGLCYGHGDMLFTWLEKEQDEPSVTELLVNFLMERPLVATYVLWTVP